MTKFAWVVLVWAALPAWASAQDATLRLPLPIDGVAGVQAFESVGPTASVLTGLQFPADGPLTAWAGVFSSLGADGRLGAGQNGGWTGRLPPKWVRVVKAGYAVAGFRVLVRVAPAPVETRQVQVFWRAWSDGVLVGPVVESPVYGSKAGPQDTVKILELRVPDDAVPTGLYGQTLGGAVVQASLMVRQNGSASSGARVEPSSRGPAPVAAPPGPRAPAPAAPVVAPLLN